MNLKTLAIYLGEQRVGLLFQYGNDNPILRFVADDAFVALGDNAPTLSLSMRADDPETQRALWANVSAPVFNGRQSRRKGWLLPPFFQGLLPEGVFRDHVAAVRGCEPDDHFEMLAATGRDLPGNVHARPVTLTRQEAAHLVTQDEDSLEMSVIEEPMEDGVSVSGVQPKVGVIRDGDRYVGRTRMQDTHIIAKLPVVGHPLLPELEELSLRLARAAGVDACEAKLEPLEKLAVEHGYDLGNDVTGTTNFLAVTRFDRAPGSRFHVEDFGQVMAVQPEDKYRESYLAMAAIMLAQPSLGEAAVHELLRRMTVNELLGNPDMHLKNVGIIYKDGKTPTLSPAYDIVGYSAYQRRTGHAIFIVPPELLPPSSDDTRRRHQHLSPAMVRQFCGHLRLPEKPAAAEIQRTVLAAVKSWPEMILASQLTDMQKTNLLAHFEQHPMVMSVRKRAASRARAASLES